MADQQAIASGKTLSYEDYSNLFQSAAQNMDNAMRPKGSRTTRCNVYSHASSGLLNDGEASGGFTIDTSLDEVQAFMTTHVPGSHMPAQCWHKISAAGQVTWDELSDSDKATILGADTGSSGCPMSMSLRHLHALLMFVVSMIIR
jgi:hypothetical protein